MTYNYIFYQIHKKSSPLLMKKEMSNYNNHRVTSYLTIIINLPPLSSYCDTKGSSTPTGPCKAGYYCTGTSPTAIQHEVEAGHYSEEGAVDQTQCSPGTYSAVRYFITAFITSLLKGESNCGIVG